MNVLIILVIFLVSTYQTIRRGPGGTFVYVFIPVLLLLGVVRPVSLPVVPDVTSLMAVSYGTLLGMLIGGKFPGFRPHFVDLLVVLLSVSTVISAVVNGEFWTLVSAAGNEILRWIVPYYMARVAFRDVALRQRLTVSLCWIAIALGAMGAVEFRLWPVFFSRLIESVGASIALNDIVQKRWAFFRAMVTCEHPIDFGNVGLLLMGLIPGLAVTCGMSLKDKRVMWGTIASAAIIVEAISFSTFIGAGVAVGIYFALRYVRFTEWLLVPGVIAVAVGITMFTASLLNVDLEPLKPAEGDATALSGSYYIRVLIVQNSWNSYGKVAGAFGWGDNITKYDLQLDSVDNSYMLFLMRRGWVHLSLRVLLALTIGVMGTLMLQRAKGLIRVPPAAFVAALLGVMASMYTVWFGFIYAQLWTLALAMGVTMQQMIAGRVRQENSLLQPGMMPIAPIPMRHPHAPMPAQPMPVT